MSDILRGGPRFPAATDRDYEMFIDGDWVDGTSGQYLRCVDPFSDAEWGRIPQASVADVEVAVAAARRAFDGGWSNSAPSYRATLLRGLGQLIEGSTEELARTQIHENGKLLSEMLPGAHALAQSCFYFAGLAESMHGDAVISSMPGTTTFTLRQPVGVVAAVTPWNSPLGLLGLKLFPALAAGCTVVIKPSEVTPTSTLRLAELCQEAGFPRGVVNIVTGGAATGEALVSHPGVDKISFTGSTGTGRQIARIASERFARVSLELGGKSPNIVFADADLDNAVHGVMAGIFAATGQTCMAGSRVLVEHDILDDFVAGLADRVSGLRLGDPLDSATEVGPIACREQLGKVISYIGIGREEGAALVIGGHRPAADGLRDGLFIEPTIFSGVQNRSRLAQEEIFGPVASVIPFLDEADAVRIANDTEFGLTAGVWTENVGKAQRMAHALQSGTVWINTYRRSSYAVPYGGMKLSGVGREGGPASLDAYTEEKAVWIDHGNQQVFGRRVRQDLGNVRAPRPGMAP